MHTAVLSKQFTRLQGVDPLAQFTVLSGACLNIQSGMGGGGEGKKIKRRVDKEKAASSRLPLLLTAAIFSFSLFFFNIHRVGGKL